MQTYRAKKGMGDLMGAVLGGGGYQEDAYQQALQGLYGGANQRAQAIRHGLEGRLLEDQANARAGLGDALAGSAALLPPGADPAALATLLRAGSRLHPTDISGMIGDLQGQGFARRAVDTHEAGNADLGNVMLRAAGLDPYTPYSQNTAGQVLNQATGAIGTDSPLVGAAVGKAGADARAADALARQRGYIASGGTLFDLADPGAPVVAQPWSVEGGHLVRGDTGDYFQLPPGAAGPDKPKTVEPLNAQLAKYFQRQAVDSKGRPAFDPFSGQPVMEIDQAAMGRFLSWMSANGFTDMNEALAAWLHGQQTTGGGGGGGGWGEDDPLGIR